MQDQAHLFNTALEGVINNLAAFHSSAFAVPANLLGDDMYGQAEGSAHPLQFFVIYPGVVFFPDDLPCSLLSDPFTFHCIANRVVFNMLPLCLRAKDCLCQRSPTTLPLSLVPDNVACQLKSLVDFVESFPSFHRFTSIVEVFIDLACLLFCKWLTVSICGFVAALEVNLCVVLDFLPLSQSHLRLLLHLFSRSRSVNILCCLILFCCFRLLLSSRNRRVLRAA
jgi:hypothetical protein